VALHQYYTSSILLAEDDEDDRLFFADALQETDRSIALSFVENGMELMSLLHNTVTGLPGLLFLDMNMPCKNGLECLREIRHDERYCDLPVIIFSTSLDQDLIADIYENGANLSIVKPSSFQGLKRMIDKVLSINWKERLSLRENFVLNL
jgi:CheY-like chemotaxis protein